MALNANEVTPCLMVKNEEYWIHYVLRDLLKVFPEVILLDTGSTDDTVKIAKETGDNQPGELVIVQDNYSTDTQIGNGRNVLRSMCNTYWMFLIDGDEIWREDKLRNMFDYTIPGDNEIVMVAGWNVEDIGGKLQLRTNDLANRDGLFAPSISWYKLDYPFESYGLSHTFPMEKVMYMNGNEVYAWHMRHTLRSSKNGEVYFRDEKKNYYPYDGGAYEDMPEGWLGKIEMYNNPYLR